MHLRTGQSATLGSPVSASPDNPEPLLVEIVDDNESPIGSFLLDPGESVDARFTSSDTVEVQMLVGSTEVTIAGRTETIDERPDRSRSASRN